MAQTPNVGLKPVIVVHKGDGPGTLVNKDLVNSVLIGLDMSIVGNNPNASVLDPLVGIPMDGMDDIYACTLTAQQVVVDYIPRARSWNASAALQAQQLIAQGLAKDTTVAGLNTGIPSNIFGTGVPLYSKSQNIYHATSTFTAGGTVNIGPFSLPQIGYEIAINLYNSNAASVNPTISFVLTWSDSISGQITKVIDFALPVTDNGSASPIKIAGTGPTEGDTLNIAMTNADPTFTPKADVAIVNDSRFYLRHDWSEVLPQHVPGFTNATNNEPANLLLSTSASVTASGTLTRRGMTYAGQVLVHAGSLGPFDLQISSVDPIASAANILNYESHVTAAAGGFVNDYAELPRAYWIMQLTNNDTVSRTLTATVTRHESIA